MASRTRLPNVVAARSMAARRVVSNTRTWLRSCSALDGAWLGCGTVACCAVSTGAATTVTTKVRMTVEFTMFASALLTTDQIRQAPNPIIQLTELGVELGLVNREVRVDSGGDTQLLVRLQSQLADLLLDLSQPRIVSGHAGVRRREHPVRRRRELRLERRELQPDALQHARLGRREIVGRHGRRVLEHWRLWCLHNNLRRLSRRHQVRDRATGGAGHEHQPGRGREGPAGHLLPPCGCGRRREGTPHRFVVGHIPRAQIILHAPEAGDLGAAVRAPIEVSLHDRAFGGVALLIEIADESFSLITHRLPCSRFTLITSNSPTWRGESWPLRPGAVPAAAGAR